MADLPQLFDAAPDLYEACVENAKQGHKMGCQIALNPDDNDITNCTCGQRETLKAIAYARGDDPLKVDKGDFEL